MELPKSYGSEHFLRTKRPKKIKKVFIAQMDEIDCGAACLSMITSALGNPVPLSKTKKALDLTQHGTSLFGIVVASDRLGLETCSLQTNYEDLLQIRMPGIIHFKSEKDNEIVNIDHFVVVYEVKKNSVIIADPSFGLIQISKNEFLKRWTGIVLTFNETPQFYQTTHHPENAITVSSMIKSNQKALLFTAFISLVMTVIALIPTKLMGKLIDQLGINSTQGFEILAAMALGILASRLLGIFLKFLRDRVSIRLSSVIEFKLVSQLHGRAMKLPMKEISIRKTGDLLSRIHGMGELESFISQNFIEIFLDLIMTMVFLVFLFLIHPQFGWIAVLTFGFISIYSYFVSNWAKRSTYRLLSESSACESLMIQNLRYVGVIKSLGSEGYFIRKWLNKSRHLVKKQNHFKIHFNQLKHVEGFFALLSDMAVLFLGISLVKTQTITLGEMIVAQGFFMQFMSPLYGLTQAYDALQRANVSLERANDLLSIQKEESGADKIPEKCDSLELKNVEFAYESLNPDYLLKGIDIKINSGEFLLITGKSGAGKTTLIQLMLRMHDPMNGQILFNGKDLKDFNLSDLRKKIGYVSQEPILLPLSIEQNITFGDDDRDEAHLENVLNQSNCIEFISRMDRGLKTILQEDGKGLSGGQKQRIALARALYRSPSVLIMDEPTSALDKASEKSFIEAIQKLKGKMVIIMCTHKAESFDFADRIIEIKNGKAYESRIKS